MAKVYIWKLGSLEYNILPSKESINNLARALLSWDGKSDFDLIWNPAIDVKVMELNAGDMHLIVPDDVRVVREGNVLRISKRV